MPAAPLRKPFVYLIFGLSGFCALVYEILWTKHLSLTFGTSILAVSTVAATFMAGLALGSFLFGRLADRCGNLLRLYALLEAGIALFALLFVPTLSLVDDLYVALVQAFPSHDAAISGLRILFSAILLLPPSACMGGTFPLMCRLFARRRSGGQIGRLYALNTLGATCGAFLCGFYFIPSLGLSRTGLLAVSLNALAAALAWLLAPGAATLRPPVEPQADPPRPFLAREHRLVLVTTGLVGFIALAYEILWTRVFLLFLGNTSYAFALMLSAYLVGLALGGGLYARLVRPEMDERRLFLLLTLLSALSVLAALPFYDRLPRLFLWAHETAGERWWLLSGLRFGLVFAVMALPTLLSGALLPAAVAILDPGRTRTGEGVGLVVLHNTVGAVLGSLAAGFLLIPGLGVLGGFRLLAALNLLIALPLGRRYCLDRSCGRWPPALLACGLALALWPYDWDPQLMNSGVYCYAAKYTAGGGLDKVLARERILEVIEGTDTTVAVHEGRDGGERFFTVNGKTDGGTGRDLATQLLVGQVPLLLHSGPEKVLVIGLGTGITLRGMSAHPTAAIDCVEISPEVVAAAGHFSTASAGALDDPKVRLHVQDGRNLLLVRPGRYDVIVSEPSNPWQTGNANLFTDEFYRLAAHRLEPDGIFCQWLGLYDITPDNLRMASRTFLRTFPRALAFIVNSDLILVGSRQPLAFDYRALARRMEQPLIAETLAAAGVASPGDLLARHFVYGGRHLSRFAGSGPLNTDDHPVLEFSARFNLGERTLGAYQMENLRALLAVRDRVVLPLDNLGGSDREIALALRELAAGFARSGRAAEAEHFLREARALESVVPERG